MGDLVLKGATSGQITLSPVGTAGTNTLTLPAKTGNIITSADSGTVTQTMLGTNVAGNGPAFIYTKTASQALSAITSTQLTYTSKLYDTNNAVSSSTFTCPVAGYYQINAGFSGAGPSSGDFLISIYRNGVTYAQSGFSSASSYTNKVMISNLVYLAVNDTISIYGYVENAQTLQTEGVFSGCLVRSA